MANFVVLVVVTLIAASHLVSAAGPPNAPPPPYYEIPTEAGFFEPRCLFRPKFIKTSNLPLYIPSKSGLCHLSYGKPNPEPTWFCQDKQIDSFIGPGLVIEGIKGTEVEADLKYFKGEAPRGKMFILPGDGVEIKKRGAHVAIIYDGEFTADPLVLRIKLGKIRGEITSDVEVAFDIQMESPQVADGSLTFNAAITPGPFPGQPKIFKLARNTDWELTPMRNDMSPPYSGVVLRLKQTKKQSKSDSSPRLVASFVKNAKKLPTDAVGFITSGSDGKFDIKTKGLVRRRKIGTFTTKKGDHISLRLPMEFAPAAAVDSDDEYTDNEEASLLPGTGSRQSNSFQLQGRGAYQTSYKSSGGGAGVVKVLPQFERRDSTASFGSLPPPPTEDELREIEAWKY